jgi:hypothetical protein
MGRVNSFFLTGRYSEAFGGLVFQWTDESGEVAVQPVKLSSAGDGRGDRLHMF